MERQDVFDIGARGVFKQGRPSIARSPNGDFTGCMYRGLFGSKCLIGHLIPDEVYRPTMDNGIGGRLPMLIDDLAAKGVTLLDEPMNIQAAFLKDLQECHDRAAALYPGDDQTAEFLAEFAGRLRAFAMEVGLSTAVLDELAPQ